MHCWRDLLRFQLCSQQWMGGDHASHRSLHSSSREIKVRKFELARLPAILYVSAVELGGVGVVALLVVLTRDFPHGTVPFYLVEIPFCSVEIPVALNTDSIERCGILRRTAMGTKLGISL